MTLLIDNYDSFSYNLFQMVGEFDPDIKVVRNDEIKVDEIRQMDPDRIIFSPGPGRPENAGIMVEAIGELAGEYPMLGICLGHQAICMAFGADITYAPELMHGKQSEVSFDERCPLFEGLGERGEVARYHSLIADPQSIPDELVVVSETQNHEIMGVMHKSLPIYGLQFHPESILTPLGRRILSNFLSAEEDRKMDNNIKAKDSLEWEEISTEHIVRDEWIDFRRSAYRFPDGSVFEPYYSYSRRDYVVIVASDTEGNYLCVRQFRHGIKQVTTEFPAGGIERKDGKEYGTSGDDMAEDALETAKRELMEETGYESDEWTHLITVPSNATIADNYAYLFMAKNARKVSGQSLDETEFLNVEKHTAEEIESLISEEKFQQAIHITAWLLANRLQKP